MASWDEVLAYVNKLRPHALEYPPGTAAHIAEYIFDSSYSPIPEVAITATLGLLAAVCGRAYRTPTDMDLSLYLILAAKTGRGKNAIHEVMPKLVREYGIPGSEQFIRSEDFASGPALHKALLVQPGFLNLQGEFGQKLRGMANPNNAPMRDLRTLMIKAYGNSYLEGKGYSKADNSLCGVPWPAFSFLGETTPKTFLESLTHDMMEDGFMSRFITIFYTGDRPLPNKQKNTSPPHDAALQWWHGLLAFTLPRLSILNAPEPVTVQYDEDAQDKLDNFELECTENINRTDDEFELQMWNRAHLKVLKVASLLAVADNYIFPVINNDHATWAMKLVERGMDVFERCKLDGDIGSDDHSREQKLKSIIVEYAREAPPATYGIPDAIRDAGIITRKYLQKRTCRPNPFINHKSGATAALNYSVHSLIDSGYLAEVDKARMVTDFGFHGKAYYVLNLE